MQLLIDILMLILIGSILVISLKTILSVIFGKNNYNLPDVIKRFFNQEKD